MMMPHKNQNRSTASLAQESHYNTQQSSRLPELGEGGLEGRNQGSVIFQRAADHTTNNSLSQVNGDIPEVLNTPGATSSVRLSDTNLNGDDLEQLQELHQMQNVLRSSAALNADKGAEVGHEGLDAANHGQAEPEDQGTPRMHPLDYLRAEAEKDAVGQPQEALVAAEGQSEREFQQKRELTCIEEELMDYSPTRSLPSLVAPSQGDAARLSQSRKLDGLQGALRGSIRESNQTLNKSMKWPEATLKEKDDGPAAGRTSANVLMTPMDGRNARGIEEMNMASPDARDFTDRSNPMDPAAGQRSAQQQEHRPGGIQNLMRPYSKPTLQKKMTDLKMVSNPGQQQAAVTAHNPTQRTDARQLQLSVVDSSPGEKSRAAGSTTQERNDEMMKDAMSQIRNVEEIAADNRSQSVLDGIATGAETQDGPCLALNEGVRSAKAFQASMNSTPQGPNPQSQRGSARQTGPQADTKLTQPKKRNKSFNQWRQTQQKEKSALALATGPNRQDEGASKGPEGSKMEQLNRMLSQSKFQLQAKRSPEPRSLATGALGGLESANYVTAQFSSNQQTPEDGSVSGSRAIPLSQFHIFQSVGLQDILQRESNASTQQKVPADVFYNNPAQSVIVNVESPSPDGKEELEDNIAKPDSLSMVLEPGKSMSQPGALAVERQKTEDQRRSHERGRVSETAPDMVFTEGDVRSSVGLRDGGLNTQSLAMKAPSQLPATSSPDDAYFVPAGQMPGPVGIETQDASHILKNLSSHVDSDHEEQTDLLNQMLGLPGDHEKSSRALQEPEQNAQSERTPVNEHSRKVDQGKKRPELRKSQAIVRQKLELQKQMYFQTTSQQFNLEAESGQRGPQERVHAQSQVEPSADIRPDITIAAAQPGDFELQQRISEALRSSQTPGRTSAHQMQHGESKSLASRILSPQANNQHLKVIHNRPAVSNSKNTHHHRFGSKTSLGTYHKSGKQESRFEHTSSSQFQHQKTPGSVGVGSFVQKEGNSLGRRKQSAVIQSSRAGEAEEFRLNNQKNEQPGPRLLTAANSAAGATISLAAVTASVRSTSKEKIDLAQPQHAQKRSNVLPSGEARQAAQKALQVSEQQLDRYQQEYLERLNRAKQAESQKSNLDGTRVSQNQSNLRSGGTRVRNARSPGTPLTQQATQMEKAVNARRKQLGSPTNNALSTLQQARLSESVLHHSRAETSAGRYGQSSVLGTQKAQKMQIEWKQICKLFDSLPQGASLKGRYSFSRNDIISVVSQFRRKIEDLEALVQYEQQKNVKQDRDYNGLLEELKEVKIEKRHYQEQLNRIPDLEIKIEQQSQKLTQCITFLKKCMVSSVVCLEFNKDIQTLMNKFQYGIRNKQDPQQNKDKTPMQQQMQVSHWQGVQEVVKAVSELQEQHHLFQAKEVRPQSTKPDYEQSFSANIDLIEGFINDLIQFQQSHTVYEKVVKVDLENMSSGTDDDDDDEIELDGQGTQRILSEDEGQQLAADAQRLSEMNYSQHDSEICRIKIKAESMYNYNPSSTNIDNTSQYNNDHYTQLAGKSRKEIDESASTRVKQSPLTVAPSPVHRGDSAKQKKQQATAQSTSKRQLKSFVVAQNRMTGSVQKPPMVTVAPGSSLGLATISLASKTSKGAGQTAGGETLQAPQPPRPSGSKQTRKSRQSRLHKKGQQPANESRQLSSIHSVTSPGKSDSKLGSAAPQKASRAKNLKGPVTEETMREINKEATGHYEKVMQELQSKKLQYSVLLEKYEHKARRVMELQDEIAKFADYRNEQEIRRQCQEQFAKLEQQHAQLALKNEGLQQQIRDYQKEIYQQEQTQQNYQQQINNLKTYMQTQHQLLQEDEKVAELEKAVITLCNNQLAQKFENITSKDKQMLQAVFGDGFLIQNQMRADLVRAREVAQFLLNDVAIEIFDFFEKLDRNALQRSATHASQAIKLGNQKTLEQQPLQSLYYEKGGANDGSLTLAAPEQPQVYQTQARKGQGPKLPSAEHGVLDQMAKSASQNRQSSTPALGFVNQLQQKKGKNMEADLNFNLFNDYEADDSPHRPVDATLEEPRGAYSAAKRGGAGQPQSPREAAAMTNRSTRSMNTMKSGERKSVNTRRTSQLGGRGGGQMSAQAALLKRISQQNKFLDEIKSQVQVMYDRHEALNDFIQSDEARESLLRHISVAARKPGEFGDEPAMSSESKRPRAARRDEDSSMMTEAQFLAEAMVGDSKRRGHDSRRGEKGTKSTLEKSSRARNPQLKFTGSQLEALTGGGELVQADFITEREGFDESMAMLPQTTSQLDRYSNHINTSSLQDESQMYPPGYGGGQRKRLRPNQSNRHLSTQFP